ncbi:MAG: zinc ABC transporter substrate-binding protein [Leucobacter sp.]
MLQSTRPLVSLIILAAAAATLTGCAAQTGSDTAATTTAPAGDTGKVQIVASTNVYGDIAAAVAGDAAEVTSVMSDPSQDPHSFEADAHTQLAISKADILIENGGGYDDFMDTMREAADNADAVVINAVELSGKDDGSGELNEHVWYDFPTAQKVADAIAADLAKADPDHQADFEQNAKAFSDGIAKLEDREQEISATADGAGVAVTEPVPLYLLEACGFENRTPEEFSEAIEEETDVPPAALQETLDLFSKHEVKLLALNAQTTGPESEKVEEAAKSTGIPVVRVTETVPDGEDYLSWMSANLDAVAEALQQ